ncbi:MAG: SpoIIE family protein phosphatase [Clostridiales bacterium]|jgi:serine/threonine protein phosphatase PrpC|nr:SpoIIE family protein phosphatase [Clostridiales bacterium]
MNFIEVLLSQKIKSGVHRVCGDYCVCERTEAGTLYVLCDGIGSGVYANIAAILSAERLTGLMRGGMPQREAAELVASSMHRARSEDIPYSAFSVALVLPDGFFTVYTYDAPTPVFLGASGASALTPRFYNAGYEVIAESEGRLREGDALLLMSDGVTQSGMGHGYGLGIGSEGAADFINRNYKTVPVNELPEQLTKYCASLANRRYEDDTTAALLHCRKAAELTLLTGPPSRPNMDKTYAEIILNGGGGKKVVCGSTTLDIIARELGVPAEAVMGDASLGAPPEYTLPGVDLAAEGAVTLNQVCNIIDEPPELFEEENVVQKLCVMLKASDVVHLHIGTAANDAHESLFFKQMGVRLRRSAIKDLTEKLRGMGKLVTEKYY